MLVIIINHNFFYLSSNTLDVIGVLQIHRIIEFLSQRASELQLTFFITSKTQWASRNRSLSLMTC